MQKCTRKIQIDSYAQGVLVKDNFLYQVSLRHNTFRTGGNQDLVLPLRWTGQIRKNADKLLLQGIVAEITYAIRYDHIVRMFQRNQTKH